MLAVGIQVNHLMGLEIFALVLAGSQLAMYGAVIGKSIRDKTKEKIGLKVSLSSSNDF